jgi:hypothetical protein
LLVDTALWELAELDERKPASVGGEAGYKVRRKMKRNTSKTAAVARTLRAIT